MKIIAIDATDINSLGGLLHLKQIAKVLSKKKVNLIIFSNTFISKNFKTNLKINIVKKKIFDKNFFLRYLWKLIFLKSLLKKKNCNILISLNGIYHGFFRPTLLLQQNVLPFENHAKKRYNFISNIKFFLQKKAILLSIKFHRNVIFTSHDFKKKILNHFNYKNTLKKIVIYHGVFKQKKTKKKIIFQKKIRLLFVSEFQKYKNHENLFKAIEMAKNKNISLTCMGRYQKSYLEYLKLKYDFKKLNIKIIKNSTHIKTLNIYKNYDAFIFPSLCESFGLPVLEAAANKIPILCSNLRIFKEIYGQGCFYFNPNTSRSILNGINNFLLLNKNQIKNKINISYEISKNLSWNKCGNYYYDIILKSVKSYEKKN